MAVLLGCEGCSGREGLWLSEEEEKAHPFGILGLVRSKEMRQRMAWLPHVPSVGLGAEKEG